MLFFKTVIIKAVNPLPEHTAYYDRFEKEHKEKLAELYEELPGDKEPLLDESDIRDGSFLDQCFDLDTDFIRVLKSILELKSHPRLMKPDAEIIIFKAVSDNAFIKQAEICHVLSLN